MLPFFWKKKNRFIRRDKNCCTARRIRCLHGNKAEGLFIIIIFLIFDIRGIDAHILWQ